MPSRVVGFLRRAGLLPKPRLIGRHGTADTYTTGTGQVLVSTHPPNDECHEYGCVIHAPSPEAQSIGRTHWRSDRNMMERICRHGVGHPDPDSQAWATRHFGSSDAVHGCDGCCAAAYEALKEKGVFDV